MQIKKAFLIFSFVAVTIFGLMYGISPKWYAETFLNITDLNLNVAHILRAIAGLYLALAAFWLYAAFHDKYRDAATPASSASNRKACGSNQGRASPRCSSRRGFFTTRDRSGHRKAGHYLCKMRRLKFGTAVGN
jgi:Domain of unknown function (DUF4345)